MYEEERVLIIKELLITDKVILSIDMDKTVCATLNKLNASFSSEYDLYFANGGDQSNNTIPEKEVCSKLNIKLIDGLGNKVQSSSWLLKNNNR